MFGKWPLKWFQKVDGDKQIFFESRDVALDFPLGPHRVWRTGGDGFFTSRGRHASQPWHLTLTWWHVLEWPPFQMRFIRSQSRNETFQTGATHFFQRIFWIDCDCASKSFYFIWERSDSKLWKSLFIIESLGNIFVGWILDLVQWGTVWKLKNTRSLCVFSDLKRWKSPLNPRMSRFPSS